MIRPPCFTPRSTCFTSQARLAVFVGSSNLTLSGFCRNVEVNTLLEGEKSAEENQGIAQLLLELDKWHSSPLSKVPARKWLDDYRKRFEETRAAQRKAKKQTALNYEEQVPATSWLPSASWDTYYAKVAEGLSINGGRRWEMLDFIADFREKLLPWRIESFIDLDSRRKIGGMEPYGWFGHVGASGQFRSMLANGPARTQKAMVAALNEIGTLEVPIDWGRLSSLLDRLISLGPTMKIWSRLVCLMRPDLYCTIASPRVRKNLSMVLETAQDRFASRDGYIELTQMIHASP
jgi:hypothetical protein